MGADTPAHAALTLDKRLPVASGIGGGSADAAAALRLLNRLWGLDWPIDRLLPIAAQLGSDVPACLVGRSLRGEGRGERLDVLAAPRLTGRPLLLANPGIGLSTATVFAHWDGVDRGALPPGDDADAIAVGRNDLEPPAIAAVPAIADLLGVLRRHDPQARMSGSGATCFALFASAAARDAAAVDVMTANPAAWVMATHVA